MKKILIVAATIVFAALGCKGPGKPEVDKMAMADIAIDESVGNSAATDPPSEYELKAAAPGPKGYSNRYSTPVGVKIEKKIIKEGDIHFKTGDINETRKTLYASLKKLGGYVAEESENNDSESGQKEITLQTRIPAKNFDAFLTNVSANAESIDSKNIRIQDVTTRFIDVTTQLANKKKLEERYLELLKKGSKISDLLEIENKLTEIRSDIESTQGQLNYLSKQVEFSSLDITFYSKQTAQDNGQSFGYKIKTAVLSGWQILGSLFFGFVAWWPIWLVLLGGIVFLRRWAKR
ncbi:DUF4349 domain-containing protein [Mucilaginibacter calamicampi]|uniref:DUF4349 domain-containing protein n=1 Tax=Mucilaginibacter calamicampi TaxID=1302352 RepID=A0ABW2YY63_9SPHI